MPKSCWCVGAVPQNNTVSRGDFRAQSHSRLNDGISSTQNIWVLPWTRFIYVLDAVSSYNNKCENHFSHSSVRLSSLSEKSSPFPCFAYSTQVLRHAGLPFVMSQRTKIWKSPKILNVFFLNQHTYDTRNHVTKSATDPGNDVGYATSFKKRYTVVIQCV